jgi:hypothetical protein
LLRTPRKRTAHAAAHSRSKALSAALKQQIEYAGLGPVELEHRFHATRKWRLDLVLPKASLAIEIEGGVFLKQGGRHNRGAGMRADMEKYAEAVIAGWRLIRILPEWIKNGRALDYIRRAAERA